jgi:hypothetical protein
MSRSTTNNGAPVFVLVANSVEASRTSYVPPLGARIVRFNHIDNRSLLGYRTDWLFVGAGHYGASTLLVHAPFDFGQLHAPECVHARTRVVLVGADGVSVTTAQAQWPRVERLCMRTPVFQHPITCNSSWAPRMFERHNPSTGLVALAHLRSLFPAASFELLGWTFHADQRKTFTTHNFGAEEKLIRSFRNVRLLHAPSPTRVEASPGPTA